MASEQINAHSRNTISHIIILYRISNTRTYIYKATSPLTIIAQMSTPNIGLHFTVPPQAKCFQRFLQMPTVKCPSNCGAFPCMYTTSRLAIKKYGVINISVSTLGKYPAFMLCCTGIRSKSTYFIKYTLYNHWIAQFLYITCTVFSMVHVRINFLCADGKNK